MTYQSWSGRLLGLERVVVSWVMFQFSLNISDDPKEGHSNLIERAEIAQLVRSRMQSLALPPEDYDDVSEKRNSLSFVIINPSCDLKLEEGDIV
ncbi:Potassium channel subfamily T member 1-like 1 [Homarus americanus]|uniref:Potassium channel subfamily T member 1-like 1 n=1 Tax=Homarus americanus TaxID=6706 RepID=A0A8J5K5Y1_HOMAM|nr:Potassium channel subfamily T member 1-like 1 [Homarus americanus]